jgi:hypothetical protein
MMARFTDERSAVIQCAEYEAPRVLRMDLTNQLANCVDGYTADIMCNFGAGF